MLKGHMVICRNAEEVHGQRKVGSPWARAMVLKIFDAADPVTAPQTAANPFVLSKFFNY